LFCCDAFKHPDGHQQWKVLGELNAVAAKLSPYDDRTRPVNVGKGKLDMIDERPDPIFVCSGMTARR